MLTIVERHQTPLDGAVLVRLRSSDATWIQRLPSTPDGMVLSATVSSEELAAVPIDELIGAGVRLVGRHQPPPDGGGTVYLLVPGGLADGHPDWLRTLGAQADRVFDLDHGPVRLVLADEIALHLAEHDAP